MQPSRVSAPSGRPRRGAALYLSLPILAWALYDFANTIFASNIITIFFPFYLKDTIGGSETANQIAGTFITYTNALSSVFLVLLSPLYGVWIDRTGRKKAYLVPFTLACVVSTALMGAAAGYWQTDRTIAGLPLPLAAVLLLFMIAKFTYNSCLVFYDAMISDLGREREIPLISGFGVATGYIGTLVGLCVYPLVGENLYHRSFLPSALLFLLFSLPIFLWYKEPRPESAPGPKPSFFSGYREIAATFREARDYRPLFLFMIAYFFFNDAVATAITVMGVYATTVIGFTAKQFILLYLVSTVSSIIGSFAFGYVTRSLGSKRSVSLVALVMIAAIALASLAFSEAVFWAAGSLYGVAMGAMWVASRTMIVELSPPDKRGQFFGLFAFSGKVSSIVGPLLYGSVTWALAGYGNIASRIALGSLLVLVMIGLLFHLRVPYGPKRSS
ncbi:MULTISPECIES: MFS transporter [Paenibacillus]|uniref:MFS transporter n=1 Tax=Paenibacillus TaxID=44249 RepID=UPI0022B8F2ED|nr:MFS transporter [Paenibacillus caseinilyticus]MCZ8519144.1 MFS transporter [Paenibacillus caseinilyticus]